MKQVIVMRNDLNMRKGKMIAQGAHATLMAIFSHDFRRSERWLQEGMKKICVRVDSEAELRSIIDQAKAAGLLCGPVTDSGATEFHGVPTLTCCAIGPDEDEAIDKITGGLKLL